MCTYDLLFLVYIYRVFNEEQESDKATNQIAVEDPGYFTCISDSSSKSSQVLNSDIKSPSVLVKDPVMLGSSGQDPVPNGDISVSVLDSGHVSSNEPSDVDLIVQLDALLNDEGAHTLADMVIGDTQEVLTCQQEVVSPEEAELLDSETVTNCFKEPQQTDHIAMTTHLVAKQQVCV